MLMVRHRELSAAAVAGNRPRRDISNVLKHTPSGLCILFDNV
jgi:hypothetical protein